MAQFQGVLALLQRMVAVETIDVSKAEALLIDVLRVPLNADGAYAGAIARWIMKMMK